MYDIESIAIKIINDFIKGLNENKDTYYFDKVIVEKQELSNEYDSNTVDDICECITEKLEQYLKENNLNGFVDNGYNEIVIVR